MLSVFRMEIKNRVANLMFLGRTVIVEALQGRHTSFVMLRIVSSACASNFTIRWLWLLMVSLSSAMIQTATSNNAPLDLVIYSVGQAMHALFADVVKANVEDVMPRIMAVNFYGAGMCFRECIQSVKGGLLFLSLHSKFCSFPVFAHPSFSKCGALMLHSLYCNAPRGNLWSSPLWLVTFRLLSSPFTRQQSMPCMV